MKATYHNIVKYIYRLENKIAFYPTILSFLGMLMFNNLMETSKIANINYRSVVLHELDSLHEDISHVIKNKNDLEVLELEITAIKNKF
ncbi:hypothetical protein [Jejuia pallidilutea]|uniref:Uncharacterized protein n=1 Tax=Jejuia pallidilutea TaxID=504487 RepID=A0A090WH17_9FLAO|nr:hypothetical protein [Jejuia pallidilutea]GAL66807.1 hypothetical protein JCM19301_1351 [Jejuia pallidilutea]GAL70405.1 hypothetical protein JCM19302_3527 [Jejuia pallidilutea]GAL90479.1 hypothetical protein JCM19538_244 [Jejuia pallidilutea]